MIYFNYINIETQTSKRGILVLTLARPVYRQYAYLHIAYSVEHAEFVM
jgi:hypothetical protein